MKVVINNCFDGFGLSPEAVLELYKRGGPVEATPIDKYYGVEHDADSIIGKNAQLANWRKYKAQPDDAVREHSMFLTVFSDDETLVLCARETKRHDPMLVQLVEEMGAAANGACAQLKVVEIPDGVEYEIAEYDGNEHVAEAHRTWS